MLLVNLVAELVVICLATRLGYSSRTSINSHGSYDVSYKCSCSSDTLEVNKDGYHQCHKRFKDVSQHNLSLHAILESSKIFQQDPAGVSVELRLQNMDGERMYWPEQYLGAEVPIYSVAPAGPLGHSIFALFGHLASFIRGRSRRSTLARYNTGRILPQIQSAVGPSTYGVKFYKCAQITADTELPHLMFFLWIHNVGPVGGTNLSQVAIRDSISGIVLLKSEGMVVEKGYQTFAIDSLPAGTQYKVNYTAQIKGHRSEVLDLPAFLTFSNASQNDVSMFGPMVANLSLRINSTNRIYPNHGVHFAGFAGGFFLSLMLLSLGFLAINLICARARMNSLRHRKTRGDSDPEFAVCNMSETAKEEAVFEDKMVDIMILEDPQNMYQALDNLEMSSLLRVNSSLETTRVQIYKDLIACLLSGLGPRGQAIGGAHQRLLSMLHGQLMGMEGRLKEEHVARMAALAGQCNMETREEMEVEHRREGEEKARAQRLCQHADQQEFLQCSVLLEKLHKLNQSQLQQTLLVRHEEATAKVQRQIVEWRRVELHKIFSEELEEATRMGELESSMAKRLLHDYFTCQDQLEEVLDVVLANQRCMLGERHAQRKFLVQSLHSLKDLVTETFSTTSNQIDCCFHDIRKGGALPEEQVDLLHDKTQKELVLAKQMLDEALSREKRVMHCGLVKERRELISGMLQGHKQTQKELSSLCRGPEQSVEAAQHLRCWQSLLTAQCVELAELINNLDEEAAADIRKVTMQVIQSAMTEVKAILPAASQVLVSLWPPGAPKPSFPQPEPEPGPGQAASALSQVQERLHREGKAAVRTLRYTREALQEGMERELQEQTELRARSRDFFRSLCCSQLTLSDEDLLQMKLEFQKSLSRMGRCLVLPHALTRSKLHTALASWRKEREEQAESAQPQRKRQSKGKSAEARPKRDPSERLLFQKKLEAMIQLFEREKEMDSSIMEKVLEEIRQEREAGLRTQAGGLAIQMAALHYQKAERRAKVLETSRVLLTLHSLLSQDLRDSGCLGGPELTQSIQNHCSGLEVAEQQFQIERTELESLETGPFSDKPVRDQSEYEEEEEVERMFTVQRDCRMAIIIQQALCKCAHVTRWMAKSLEESIAQNQALEDLKEQLELKRLYAHCDQDLEFASRLVKQSHVSTEVLLQALRLLLPNLPESELLSIIDALCPKQTPAPPAAESDHSTWTGEASRSILVKLREMMVGSNFQNHTLEQDRKRLQEKKQSLLDKLFLNPQLELPKDVIQVLVQEKEREGAVLDTQPCGSKPVMTGKICPEQPQPLDQTGAVDMVDEFLCSQLVAPVSSSPSDVLDIPNTGERLFVFRVPLEPQDSMAANRRKRMKRNYLNLKKCSVAPTDQT